MGEEKPSYENEWRKPQLRKVTTVLLEETMKLPVWFQRTTTANEEDWQLLIEDGHYDWKPDSSEVMKKPILTRATYEPKKNESKLWRTMIMMKKNNMVQSPMKYNNDGQLKIDDNNGENNEKDRNTIIIWQ